MAASKQEILNELSELFLKHKLTLSVHNDKVTIAQFVEGEKSILILDVDCRCEDIEEYTFLEAAISETA